MPLLKFQPSYLVSFRKQSRLFFLLLHKYSLRFSSFNISSSSSVTSQALLDLLRPRLIVSSKAFQVIFVHLVYNSALFLASCSCSFLSYIVANLICFKSAGSNVLSTPRKFLHYFCGQNFFQKNFISNDVSRFLMLFLRVQILLPYKIMGRARHLYTFIPGNMWTQICFKSVV